MALGEASDAKPIQLNVCLLQGLHYNNLGQLERSSAVLNTALELARDLQNDPKITAVMIAIGTLTKDQGRLDESIQIHTEAIEICRSAGLRRKELILLGNLGLIIQLQ